MALQRIPIKKGQPYLLVLLLIVVVAVMVALVRCEKNEIKPGKLQLEKVKSGGDTLDVAIEISPLSYRISGDSIVGLDYEILRQLSKISGRAVKFHPFAPMKDATDGLADGIYDIIVSSLPSTETLKEQYLLSDPVYLDREVLVQLKDAKPFYDSPEQLAGDTVWIASGSPFAQRIANLAGEIGRPIHIVEPEGRTAEHLVMLVARGEIPRAVVNEGLARTMRQRHYPQLSVTTPVSFTQFQCWIVSHKRRGLLDDVNSWIKEFRTTTAYDRLLERYGVAPQDTLPKRRVIENDLD